MGSIAGDDVGFGGGGGIGKEVERILVSVRVRPLNGKEVERNDPSDWECINNTTIIFKNSLPERSMFPTAYAYDRVFGYECNTRQVYEEGAKEVVLSVVSGINSSIFAYGQTSSGKTYTMTGITEHSVADIYDYIQKHKEREFVLKFSAMEIYNESVRDLLSMDSTPLRLLDDPEKGTTVEKLTEETLRDRDHLKELLSVCEAQRQIGETSLNEMSSRSHQILRLTIESSAKEYLGRDNSSTLAATVNFVDLAGSERASQALSAGTRLKEGCHINRSLLTLGTVIRKLSKGRNGHIPYRDSKLTRILQTSLGGNSRTAIICTMSPARSHVEQSRNTLLFASCAKEVVTSAQVNVVMSDKALVKQLQRELARLESELRYSGSSCTTNHSDALREKEARIKKMEKEMKELIQQRDLAQSRLEDLLQAVGNDHTSRQWEELSQSSMPHALNACEDTSSISETSSIAYQSPEFSTTSFRISHGNNSRKPKEKHALSPLRHSASSPSFVEQEKISDDSSEEFEDHCREVRCIEMDEPSMNRIEDFNLLSTEDIDSLLPSTAEATEYVDPDPIFKEDRDLTHAVEQEVSLKAIDNLVRPQPGDNGFKAVDDLVIPQPGDNSFKAVDNLFRPQPDELSQLSLAKELNSSRRSILTRSRSCRAALMNNSSSPWFQDVEQENNTPPNDFFKDFSGRPAGVHKRLISLNYDGHVEAQSGDASHNSEQNATVDVLKPQNMNAPEEGITSISNFVAGLKEMAKIQYQKKLSDEQETEQTSNKDPEAKRTIKDVCLEPVVNPSESPSSWPVEFKKKQQEIVELWHACNVSLIHRTYFFLLFKGCDSSDSIYIEVEHRRLSFLRNSSSQRSLNKTAAEDSQNLTLSTSLKNLRREREMLYRQMHKRLSSEERRSLYTEWGIALDSKQRRLQLVRRLWSEPKDMEHVRESASLVAKLIGLVEPGQALKEMFALSFAPQQIHRRSYSWRTGMSSLR